MDTVHADCREQLHFVFEMIAYCKCNSRADQQRVSLIRRWINTILNILHTVFNIETWIEFLIEPELLKCEVQKS